MISDEKIRQRLSACGLKITPQRIAIYKALHEVEPHPTVDRIIARVGEKNPNISAGTIYKTLELFAEKKLVKKVKTDADKMRYDAILQKHHHLYCSQSDKIEDYYDEELNRLIEAYFEKHPIPGFEMQDFKLQIVGIFHAAQTQ